MTMGMNTTKIFKPGMTFKKNLVEAQEDGYSRIEISYQVPNETAQRELFRFGFLEKAEHDIDLVLEAINFCQGSGHKVPFSKLMHCFQDEAKTSQFFIQ